MKWSDLRKVLIEHGVEFNLALKKPELVNLVKERVLPNLVEYKANFANVKPSSEGIIFVGF
ncbi:inner nuclear membrane protein enriched at telomere/subtelomere region [Basidiobolus ranarum]|uniref:Inner nuclear membrane protein enriched at telomere/subtelomere region n=1 Tax=Basidiobolus ranarum TaxID=34480 RepID=A0ABR2WDT8_9FUNG